MTKETKNKKNFITITELKISEIFSLFSLEIAISLVAERLNP